MNTKFEHTGIRVDRGLAGGVITSPVPHIDLLLPDGFMSFKLILTGFQVDESGEDALWARLSFDGETFVIDGNYQNQGSATRIVNNEEVITPGGGWQNTAFDIFDGYPSQVASPGWSASGEINIFPGTASLYPMMNWRGTGTLADSKLADISGSGMYVGAFGPAKAIRLFTDGSGIAKGTYVLTGIPNPA